MSEFKGTPHNSAKLGDIAKTVLMPGDPLRAKYVAEKFLHNPVCFNEVRGMLGYTGTYKGVPVSVMGSGMGMPSLGIYSYELYNFYGVENIIRVGTSGTADPDIKLFDVVLATGSWSNSTYAKAGFGYEEQTQYPSEELVNALEKSAADLGKKVTKGIVGSGDVFYMGEGIVDEYDRPEIVCGEMESFALFANARYLGKKAACMLTITDQHLYKTIATPQERQTAVDDMMEIALNAAIKL